jgi:iron complex transport system substrate-binding protein
MKINVLIFLAMLLASSIALPVHASDFVLGIFGNANMDDDLDEKDIDYLEGVIKGANPATNLSDANYDGKIDSLDIDQVKETIDGTEKELVAVDGGGNAVRIRMPVKRVVVEYMDTAELMRTLDETDIVVGVSNCMTENKKQFPDLGERASIGKVFPGEPNYEAILALNPDLYLTFSNTGAEERAEKLPGVAILYLGMYYPDLVNLSNSTYIDGVNKLGYILNKRERAKEYIDWYTGLLNKIKSRTDPLSEDEKPRVFMAARIQSQSIEFKMHPYVDKLSQMCAIAGGKDIVEILPEFLHPTQYTMTLDPEWIIEQDPSFIFVHDARTPYGYDMDDPTRMGQTREIFMNHTMLTNVAAIKTENVYVLNGIFRNDGSGGVIGALYIAKLLHPDLFKDLDPQAIHQEYLTRFQHLDFDLDKHGVFVYPPLK